MKCTGVDCSPSKWFAMLNIVSQCTDSRVRGVHVYIWFDDHCKAIIIMKDGILLE